MSVDSLRIATAGSVDDGKSTLIGRLLLDCRAIMTDQLDALRRSSREKGSTALNLAYVTDGLKTEREQGITIDVAYRYFSTPRRKFIIADTPGHAQFTRNMVTGASTADVTLILIDASRGISEQSKRHCVLSSLLGVTHVVVCVNKMDLVHFSENVFDDIRKEFSEFTEQLRFVDVTFVPISALHGDNVVERSTNMAWYHGVTLMSYLHNESLRRTENLVDVRLPVQMILSTPQGGQTQRYVAGQLSSGVLRVGDEVQVLPAGTMTTVSEIHVSDRSLSEAFSPMSITVRLADEVDVDRGQMLCGSRNRPHVSQDFEAMLCWMDESRLDTGRTYSIRHTTRETKARIDTVVHKLDVTTLTSSLSDEPLGLNDIGRVKIRTSDVLFFDSYVENRKTGSFIVIDDQTNATVAAGMIQ